MAQPESQNNVPEENGFTALINSVVSDIVYSPLNLGLLALCLYLLYKIFYNRKEVVSVSVPPPIPPMKKRDMTIQELKKYDGTGENGRVCIAVNGKIFDCTKGKHFYGPGGPYASFAGRDASRGLATFSVDVASDDYDDLSDLNSMQMDSVKEWEEQFKEKYHHVGRLLRPGEEPTDYSDEDDTSQDQSSVDAQSNQQSSKKDE